MVPGVCSSRISLLVFRACSMAFCDLSVLVEFCGCFMDYFMKFAGAIGRKMGGSGFPLAGECLGFMRDFSCRDKELVLNYFVD